MCLCSVWPGHSLLDAKGMLCVLCWLYLCFVLLLLAAVVLGIAMLVCFVLLWRCMCLALGVWSAGLSLLVCLCCVRCAWTACFCVWCFVCCLCLVFFLCVWTCLLHAGVVSCDGMLAWSFLLWLCTGVEPGLRGGGCLIWCVGLLMQF